MPSTGPRLRGPRTLRAHAGTSAELERVVGIVAPETWDTSNFLDGLLRGRQTDRLDIDVAVAQVNLPDLIESVLEAPGGERATDIVIKGVDSSSMTQIGPAVLDLVGSRPDLHFVLTSTEHGVLDELVSAIQGARVVSLHDLLMTPLTANELIRKVAGRQPERIVASPMPPPLVMYIGRTLAASPVEGRVPSDLVHQLVGDFVVGEVPSADRRQLARLSVPDELDDALAARLVGSGARDILDDLTRRGFAYWTPSPRRVVMEEPVRAALRWTLRERPAEVDEINNVTALWALDSDQAFVAVRHAVESGDFYLVSRILRTCWTELTAANAPSMTPLLSIPDDIQARFPLVPMTIALAMCAQGQASAATHPWRIAVQAAKSMKPADDPSELFWGGAVQALGLSRLGHHAAAARVAWESYEAFRRLSTRTLRQQPTSAFHMLIEVALAILAVGDSERAAEILDYTTTVAPIVNKPIVAKISEIQAWMAARDGDIPNAGRLLDWAERNAEHGVTFFGHLAHAVLALEAAEFDRALAAIDVALDDAGHAQLHGFASATRALAELYRGRPWIGLSEVARSRRSNIKQGIEATEAMTRAEVELLLTVGRTQAAFDLARTLRRKGVVNDCVIAASEIACGRNERALYRLSPYRLSGGNDVQPRPLAKAMVLASIAAYRSGQDGIARRFAEEAASVLETFALQAPLAVVPKDDPGYQLASQLRLDATGFERILRAKQPLRLSKREMTLLRTMPLVNSREDLAKELQVSVNTVKTQLRDIYRKLHTTGWAETLYTAADLGLLSTEDVA